MSGSSARPPVVRARLIARAVAASLVVASLAVASVLAAAASPRTTRARTRGWRNNHEATVLFELLSFLALPNVSTDPHIRQNAQRIIEMLRQRGLEPRLLEPKGGGVPAVFAELKVPGAKKTLGLYAHYDGQPVDAKEWATGEPFTPIIRDSPLEEIGSRILPLGDAKPPLPVDGRVYARGSSDDKGTIIAMMAALDAMKAGGAPLSVNLKVLIEGEEEIGSPHLGQLLKDNLSHLSADLWLLCDGPVHQSRRPQIVFGARGVTDVEITLYGPVKALHSGHYGNFAPNPAAELAHLVAGLRDRDGRILVNAFYDDVRPVSDAERKALAEIPDVDDELRATLGLAAERGTPRLIEGVLQPALNVRGLASGKVGAGAANAIPTIAHASIDFRLVPDQTPASVRERVEAHLKAQGYHLVTETPDANARRSETRLVKLTWGAGYPPARTSMDSPAARAMASILDDGLEKPILKVPSLGGSIPMYLFGDLKAPVLIFPIANHDNNQHAANENLRLQNLWDGIEAYTVLFEHLGPALEEAER